MDGAANGEQTLAPAPRDGGGALPEEKEENVGREDRDGSCREKAPEGASQPEVRFRKGESEKHSSSVVVGSLGRYEGVGINGEEEGEEKEEKEEEEEEEQCNEEEEEEEKKENGS